MEFINNDGGFRFYTVDDIKLESDVVISGNTAAYGNLSLVGNIYLTGDLDLAGDTLDLGTWSSGSTQGVSAYFTDASTTTFTFSAPSTAHEWYWEYDSKPPNTPKPQMKLAGDGVLTLGDPAGANKIVLDPTGGGSITVGTSPVVTRSSTTSANGDDATALGKNTTADAFASTVVGQFNEPTGNENATVWQGDGDNPVFVIANGTDAQNLSNAFIVYQNGDVRIKKRQGDILMGEFGHPE